MWVLVTMVAGSPSFVSAFATSASTYKHTGKNFIPLFTVDAAQAYDFGTEEAAEFAAIQIIDYQGRYYKPTPIILAD